jgi:hypothetical protein
MYIVYFIYFLIIVCFYILLNFNYINYFISPYNNAYSSIDFIINYILNNNIIINNVLYGIDHINGLIDYMILITYFLNIDLYYYSYQIYYVIYIIYLNKYNYINIIINNYI